MSKQQDANNRLDQQLSQGYTQYDTVMNLSRGITRFIWVFFMQFRVSFIFLRRCKFTGIIIGFDQMLHEIDSAENLNYPFRNCGKNPSVFQSKKTKHFISQDSSCILLDTWQISKRYPLFLELNSPNFKQNSLGILNIKAFIKQLVFKFSLSGSCQNS